MKKIFWVIALCCAMVSCTPKDVNQSLAEQAAAEYLVPVHPGGEGVPFWNGFATNYFTEKYSFVNTGLI